MFCLVCCDCLNQCEVPSTESKQTSACYSWLVLDLFIFLKNEEQFSNTACIVIPSSGDIEECDDFFAFQLVEIQFWCTMYSTDLWCLFLHAVMSFQSCWLKIRFQQNREREREIESDREQESWKEKIPRKKYFSSFVRTKFQNNKKDDDDELFEFLHFKGPVKCF